MIINSFVRLTSRVQNVSHNIYRFYEKRNILKLRERGMFEDMFPDTSTEEITQLMKGSTQCVYAGFDPTADSLHIGNLLILTNLLQWQRSGHQVIAVIGGATGLIGDPSHRTTERSEIDEELLRSNLESIRQNVETIFANHEKYFWKNRRVQLKRAMIVNNLDWYMGTSVIDFVREVGKHFRMGTMLGRSSVQSRLKSDGGMSFAEFTYQVFQAYDWLRLMNSYKCRFQIGGSDQMGNIVSGHDLVSRAIGEKVYGLTLPLITNKDGKKFGKSAGNVVWLSREKCSSFQLYQYFYRVPDSEVERFLKLFTFLPLDEISEIVAEHARHPERRKAQEILASNVTILVHGEEGLNSAKRTSEALYKNSVDTLARLSEGDMLQVFEGAKIVYLTREPGTTVYDLARKANCFATDSEAQRIILAGGFYVNYQKVTNLSEVVVPGIHVLSNDLTLLRVGKRTYRIVKWM